MAIIPLNEYETLEPGKKSSRGKTLRYTLAILAAGGLVAGLVAYACQANSSEQSSMQTGSYADSYMAGASNEAR